MIKFRLIQFTNIFLRIFRYEIQRIMEFTSEMEIKDNGYSLINLRKKTHQ